MVIVPKYGWQKERGLAAIDVAFIAVTAAIGNANTAYNLRMPKYNTRGSGGERKPR
nr:hypothetical protein [Marinicella sp. W31]MDC2879578.1 hypothetical protein [Marinicella sp. W31]